MLPPNPLEGGKPPQYYPNLCWLSDMLGQDILQILLSEGAGWEGYNLTWQTPSQTWLASKLHKHPESNRAGTAAGGADRGTEGADKNSHLHQRKYPWHPTLHFANSYMFTLSTRTSSPPISNPPAPRRALRAGDKGTAALLSLACKEADRELIYLPSPALG